MNIQKHGLVGGFLEVRRCRDIYTRLNKDWSRHVEQLSNPERETYFIKKPWSIVYSNLSLRFTL
jgi:hypothetical protein